MLRHRPSPTLILVLVSFACGSPPPPPLRDAGPRRDAGQRDAAADSGPPGDAGVRTDGGPTGCSIAPSDVRVLGEDTDSGERIATLASGPDRFAVLWNIQAFGVGDTGLPDVRGRHIRSDGVPGVQQQLTDNPENEGVPSIAAVGTQFVAAWPQSFGLSVGGTTATLTADLAATSTHNVTDFSLSAVFRTSVFDTSLGLMLGYTQEMGQGGPIQLWVRPLNPDGTTTADPAVLPLVAEAHPAQFLMTDLDGPAVVWSETTAGRVGIYLQRLTNVGAATGTAITLADAEGLTGVFDASFGEEGGGLVYTAVQGLALPQVRYREIDRDGQPLGFEHILATEAAARDPSIAPIAAGYAITLRQSRTATENPGIYLYLLTTTGFELEHIRIADASEQGGRTTVRVSGDGQIGIAWHDADEDTSTVSFALVRCGS